MNYSDSIAKRLAHRRRCSTDYRRALELARCSDDVAYWVNQWVWTYDNRESVSLIPFGLFPAQESFLHWLGERERLREDGLLEKSRDTGASWLCCAYALHGWLFRSGFGAGFGSRKLEYVDSKGNPKSIFEKFRIILRNLPPWMLPPGFNWRQHDNLARLVNPHNGSTITGEGGDDIGRGDRQSIYFVDEAAFLEHPDLVERSLSATTNVRIDVSTPNGPGNPFATKRFSGRVPVFTLHYRDDPRKTPDWVEKKKASTDSVAWAQEYEIDYSASLEGICIPAAWVRAAIDLDLPKSAGRPVAGLDIGEEGPDLSVLIARAGPVVAEPVAWGRCNTTETAWRARDEAEKMGVDTLCYDAGGPGMGVKGTWKTSERPLQFTALPINTGDSPTDTIWPDKQTSKEKFLNLRAEMWWALRVRFERTYEFVEKGIKHPTEDLVSIPNCPQLIAELSLPLVERTETGKIRLESKQRMKARGIKSPDYADALALAFWQGKRLRKFSIGL